MGKKYRIEYERAGCIGAAACVGVDPATWELADDGKANIINADKRNSIWTKEIDEEELEKQMMAAESCPVNIIHIVDIETGERLI